jgi:hypothetical protein
MRAILAVPVWILGPLLVLVLPLLAVGVQAVIRRRLPVLAAGEHNEVAGFLIAVVLHGGLVYIDNVENGKVLGYDDGFTLLELARKHYRNVGLDEVLLDAMIR